MKTEVLIQSTMRHLKYLLKEVGPRPAGSPEEMKAFSYIRQELVRNEYDPEFIPIRYSGRQYYLFVFILGAILLMAAATLANTIPWIALSIPLVIAGLPQLGRTIIRFSPRNGKSWDVVASRHPPQEKFELILCAHADTARIAPFKSHFITLLGKKIYYYAQRCAILLCAYSVTRVFNLQSPDLLFYLIGGSSFLCGFLWLILESGRIISRPEEYAPGAYDNGCGVSILLTLSEFFAAAPPEKIRLTYLFSGAEEAGLYGARDYATRVDPLNDVGVLNLDLVGCGEKLSIVTLDGTLFPRRTSPWMNQILRRADPAASNTWYTLKSGDHLPFLQKGIPSTSIQTNNTIADQIYHTKNDGLEIIQDYSIDLVLRTVIRFIEILENEIDQIKR